MTYQISAQLLCHDVKLSRRIDRRVDAETPPTAAAAERLLWPVAEAVLKDNGGEGSIYELSNIAIEPLQPEWG